MVIASRSAAIVGGSTLLHPLDSIQSVRSQLSPHFSECWRCSSHQTSLSSVAQGADLLLTTTTTHLNQTSGAHHQPARQIQPRVTERAVYALHIHTGSQTFRAVSREDAHHARLDVQQHPISLSSVTTNPPRRNAHACLTTATLLVSRPRQGLFDSREIQSPAPQGLCLQRTTRDRPDIHH